MRKQLTRGVFFHRCWLFQLAVLLAGIVCNIIWRYIRCAVICVIFVSIDYGIAGRDNKIWKNQSLLIYHSSLTPRSFFWFGWHISYDEHIYGFNRLWQVSSRFWLFFKAGNCSDYGNNTLWFTLNKNVGEKTTKHFFLYENRKLLQNP